MRRPCAPSALSRPLHAVPRPQDWLGGDEYRCPRCGDVVTGPPPGGLTTREVLEALRRMGAQGFRTLRTALREYRAHCRKWGVA